MAHFEREEPYTQQQHGTQHSKNSQGYLGCKLVRHAPLLRQRMFQVLPSICQALRLCLQADLLACQRFMVCLQVQNLSNQQCNSYHCSRL